MQTATSRDALDTRWAVLAVLGAAVFTRFFMIGRWSLWEDEVTSLYFSQHLTKSFPLHFPLFFALLRGMFHFTGVSFLAGRVLVAGIGVLSIALVYLFVSRLMPRPVAVMAAGFVVLSLGHLYWSQSIRYYILILVFQVLSVYLFIDGLESNKLRQLALVSVFLLLSALTHLSAILLLPVFVAYIALAIAVGDKGGGYNARGYLAFAIPFAVASAALLLLERSFQASSSSLIEGSGGWNVSGVQQSLSLIQVTAVYFGAPVTVLSVPAIVLGRGIVPGRALRFFTCLAVVPILELLVIEALNLAWPLWYQAFIALPGVATLAAITLYSLRQRGYIVIYRVALCAVLATSLTLLFAYYTTMYGDRSRIKEAAQFVQTAIHDESITSRPLVYSSKPEVVAFYFGTDPAAILTQTDVKSVGRLPPSTHDRGEWFIVDDVLVSDQLRDWLAGQCVLAAQFEAHTGPRNRTISVHRCSAIPDRNHRQEK